MLIQTLAELDALYAKPAARAVAKQIPSLDDHGRNFIALSPFLVLSTCDKDFNLDASPRGGDPGFTKISDEGHLLVPDAPGNNRLDSFKNIVQTGRVGLLFLIPGFDETLRVNGAAVLSVDEKDVRACTTDRRAPKVVVRVTPEAVYLHCAKAFLRSRLWSDASRVERTALPTMGKMINDQTGLHAPLETREEMERRYSPDL